MKLLFVLPEYPPDFGGGIGTFYGALLPALVRQGHQVDVLLGSAFAHGRPMYENDGVTVRVLETDRYERFLGSFEQYTLLPELRRYLAAAWAMHEQAQSFGRYNAVEVVDWGLMFVPWVVKPLAPTVVHMHGSSGQIDYRDPSPSGALQGRVMRMIEKTVLPGASALHTHSQDNQEEWEEITGRSVDNLPPPLERMEPSRSGPKESFGLVVGRIQKWKGPTVLCEALEMLGSNAPHVKWAGRDTKFGESGRSMDAYLTERFSGVWRKKIEPIGQVNPSAIKQLQAEAGFMIVPSLWDVYNLTAVEAMRAGSVVICSSGAGASDFIQDGINGFVFPADEPRALADLINRVTSLTEQEREAISSAARETVARKLVPEAVAAEKASTFESLTQASTVAGLDPWTVAAASPARPRSNGLSYLDHQPLREIVWYTGRRLVSKLRSSVS